MEDPIVAKYAKPGVQCFHGGQSWVHCKNFKCDFSVTTNLSGPPKSGVKAALDSFKEIEHYPDQEAWEARCHMAQVMRLKPEQILIGNGASEFIDIVPRLFPRGTHWRPGPWPAQFMEYERAALNAGLVKVPWEEHDAPITIMINPNSPTGDVLTFGELKELISKDSKSTFIIDESFISCQGPMWMDHSGIRLIEEFGDRVIIICSWTKVLACPLIRLGTVTSTENIINKITKYSVPWSVNGFAQSFLIATIHDEKYFYEMWLKTPIWKQIMHNELESIGLIPNEKSPLWVPYVFVDLLTDEIGQLVDKTAFEAGYPVRLCASFGMPHHMRLGVRLPKHVHGLIQALKNNEQLMKMIKDFHNKH